MFKDQSHRRIKTHNQTGYLIISQGVPIIRRSYLFPAMVAIIVPLLLVSMTSDVVTAENEIPVIRGDTITIQATILQNGSYGDPVQYQPIYFFDQTFNVLLGLSVSDQNGIAFIDWTIPLSHSLGPTILNATFYGNESLSLAPSHQCVSILVQSRTLLELSQNSTILVLDDLLSLDVHLVDDSNYSIPDAEISVSVNSIPLATELTNSSGEVNFVIRIDERFSLGAQSIIIHYNGSPLFSHSSAGASVEITSPISIIVRVSEDCVIGSILDVETTITDEFNRSLSDAILLFSDLTSGQNVSMPIDGEPTNNLQYLVQGPPGIHIVSIEVVGNPFIFNNQYILNFTAWSNSVLVVENSSVNHYSSPGQDIVISVRLLDWNGNGSLKPLQLFIDDELHTSATTDINGLATFEFTSPTTENQYNISIHYSGTLENYELGTKFDYNLFVTLRMPIVIELQRYEVSTPLHEISLFLMVRGMNGTLLNGVVVNFEWLSSNTTTESTNGGWIHLQLELPSMSGSHFLYYTSIATSSVESASGVILIVLSTTDVQSIEGIGITGMLLALGASIGLVTVPIVRRKYLVG